MPGGGGGGGGYLSSDDANTPLQSPKSQNTSREEDDSSNANESDCKSPSQRYEIPAEGTLKKKKKLNFCRKFENQSARIILFFKKLKTKKK